MKFLVDRTPVYAGPGIEVRMYIEDVARRTAHYVGLPSVHPITDGEMIPAALKLKKEEAQQLCDALWEAGIRPTNGEGSTGQLAAVQTHLYDVRALAFHALKCPLPK